MKIQTINGHLYRFHIISGGLGLFTSSGFIHDDKNDKGIKSNDWF